MSLEMLPVNGGAGCGTWEAKFLLPIDETMLGTRILSPEVDPEFDIALPAPATGDERVRD